MSAEALVFRLVSHALGQDDPRGALERLEGALYDCASRAHDEWSDTPRTDISTLLYVRRALADARELRQLAGYAGRVAESTPEPEPDFCPECWACRQHSDGKAV
jgi:hypothetical protein